MRRFLITGIALMLVSCASITPQTKEQIKTYNDTLHKQYFTLEEQKMVGTFSHSFSFFSPEYENITQQQNEVLQKMTQFWRTLQASGEIAEKRDAVAMAITQLSEWKTALSESKAQEWKAQHGMTSTDTDHFEDAYLVAYTDFLKMVFPNGEVVPSYTARDMGKALQFYFQ